MINTLDRPQLQTLMEQIFKNVDMYPLNSLTPCITSNHNSKPSISMLTLMDDNMISNFIKINNGMINVEICCYLKNNKLGIWKDLVLGFKFFFGDEQIKIETIIPNDAKESQEKFVQALKQTNEFVFWIANNDKQVQKVLLIQWVYENHRNLLEKLV
jgi:hypothetical protein